MPLPAQIDDDEPLASYVLETNKFKGAGIDHRQLMPSNRYGNVSVFRTKGLGFAEIAAIGHDEVALARQKPGILGWAELLARVVRAASPLTIHPDELPPRHAVIQGWPQPIEQRRTLALLLASKANVVKLSTVPSS